MAFLRPHPYRYQHPVFLAENASLENIPATIITQVSREPSSPNASDSEKPLTHARQPQPQPQAPSRHPMLPLPFQLHPGVSLLLFIPIPPILSLLYMAAGHAMLRLTQKSSSSSIYHSPILSSVEVGATGGLILSFPVALLLYLLIFVNKPPAVPEDFFEDDDGSATTGLSRWIMYLSYLTCVFFFIGIGGVAGPLGVTCLSRGVSHEFVVTKKMLSTGAATAAGFLGGIVLSVGILLFGVLIILVWLFWMRRNRLPST